MMNYKTLKEGYFEKTIFEIFKLNIKQSFIYVSFYLSKKIIFSINKANYYKI